MARRRVSATEKDSDGDILALCNKNTVWSKVSKATAISHIENKLYEYYVNVDNSEVKVIVRNGHLTTEPDNTEENNLKELPDC